MTEYCEESDLVAIRPKILELGVTDWSDQIAEAGLVVDRSVEVKWYRMIADERGVDWTVIRFNRELLLSASSQLKRAACYKSLELIFMYLMKHMIDDAFEKERKIFSELYKEEIHEVLIAGLDYDWDEDDELSSDEIILPTFRRLIRV